MAGRGPQSFKKRQKEQQRKEKQQEKLAKRIERRKLGPSEPLIEGADPWPDEEVSDDEVSAVEDRPVTH